MSTLDIFIEKGKKLDVEIGINKALHRHTHNMLINGFAVDTICALLDVTPDYVATIQKELNK